MDIRPDHEELSRAITSAIHGLEDIKARILPSACSTLQRQADSCEAYIEHSRCIEVVTADLRITALEIVAGLGNQAVSKSDRGDIRCQDTIADLLTDAKSWCDEVREEEAA